MCKHSRLRPKCSFIESTLEILCPIFWLKDVIWYKILKKKTPEYFTKKCQFLTLKTKRCTQNLRVGTLLYFLKTSFWAQFHFIWWVVYILSGMVEKQNRRFIENRPSIKTYELLPGHTRIYKIYGNSPRGILYYDCCEVAHGYFIDIIVFIYWKMAASVQGVCGY